MQEAPYNYRELRDEAREYYRLVSLAARHGVPVSLDDPDSPRTVAALRAATAAAIRASVERGA